MFNRRFLRIKVLQALYAYHQDEKANRYTHLKNLSKNIDKAYELYVFLLGLPSAFRSFISIELETQRNKYIPVPSLITPLESLYNNKAIQLLENNQALTDACRFHRVIWNNNKDLFKQLFTLLKKNAAFEKYMQKSEHTFFEDKSIVIEMLETFVAESEAFENYLEERFLNWEDDQVIVYTNVLKTLGTLKEQTTGNFLISDTLNEEDEAFTQNLFNKVVDHEDELTSHISGKAKNWDTERLAFVDLLLMKMALAEIMYFPHIPVKVSINEYLELAKLYSTPNSHGFINGVLDKVHLELKQTNQLNKTGRGLVE